jgi:hypothetical protein
MFLLTMYNLSKKYVERNVKFRRGVAMSLAGSNGGFWP